MAVMVMLLCHCVEGCHALVKAVTPFCANALADASTGPFASCRLNCLPSATTYLHPPGAEEEGGNAAARPF